MVHFIVKWFLESVTECHVNFCIRVRGCIGKMTDFLYCFIKKLSTLPTLKTIYISLMTLDVIVNKCMTNINVFFWLI
jgi:hypothetical protein